MQVVDDILSFHKQEFYPITSLSENCIAFDVQTDRNHYVDWSKVVVSKLIVSNRFKKILERKKLQQKNKRRNTLQFFWLMK